jgi:acetyl/propionyl-CoA carboxylase alpha subunit/acetyl-CoA carboxylase carboxyltransferase component
MRTDFQRVAVLNRGIPAIRIIHAIREYNLEQGTSITSIAFYTEPDRQARFVREADEAVDLEAATFLDEDNVHWRASYLDYTRLEDALTACGADAAWVGWGFVAERPDFVELCHRLGILFIGPEPMPMRRLGDKVSAKLLAGKLGIPVTPWTGRPTATIEQAFEDAAQIGYPVVVKAAAGTGGRGIRKARSEAELQAAFESARLESERTFYDPTVFIEKWMSGSRHVEVQLQGDRYGNMWAFPARDCSIQRRFQKLVAEAPCPQLASVQERSLRDAALKLCEAARYRDAATVEFLVDPEQDSFTFMEVNPRLAVEHTVTELTTGLDLVKLQLHVARGGRLEGRPPAASGHAVEVRLNAEDPENEFSAAPGHVRLLRFPTGPGLRVEAGTAEGEIIPAEYGAMFGKLSARGRSRDEALARLKRALSESAIVIAGGATNRAFLADTLERKEVRRGQVDVDWLDTLTLRDEHLSSRHADIALLDAAIEAWNTEFDAEREAFFASAARLRPAVRPDIGRQIELSYRGHRYELRVWHRGPDEYRVEMDGARVDARVQRVGPCERIVQVGGRRFRVLAHVQGFSHHVEVGRSSSSHLEADAGILRAAAPAVVVSVLVGPGDQVAAGDRLVVLEAMKMEMGIVAPFSGTVRRVMVMSNSQVGAGSPLLHLDAREDQRPRAARTVLGVLPPGRSAEKPASLTRALVHGIKAGFEEFKRGGAPKLPAVAAQLRQLVLGFDIDAGDAKRLVADYRRLCQGSRPDDEELVRFEDEVLGIFGDVVSLFCRQATYVASDGEQPLSIEQHFFRYLRALDARGSDLPAPVRERLERALEWYGIRSLEPTPTLREALLWIFKSYQRAEQQVGAISAIMERRLGEAHCLAPGTPSFVATVEKVITFAQGRFPALDDLARDVRYRYADRPRFEKARNAVYAEVEAQLDHFQQHPEDLEREARIAVLVECPQPLRGLLSHRFPDASPHLRDVLLEVLTRRYYRIRELENIRLATAGERRVLSAEYTHEEARIHLAALESPESELTQTLAALRSQVAALPAGTEAVVDLYVWGAAPLGDPEASAERYRLALDQAGFGRPLRRLVMIVAGTEGVASGGMSYFTFRSSKDGFAEVKLYRGLHPMMAKRLHLWRLKDFYVDRLPSIEDVYLFRGVARSNPKDERLFAIAEVRDVTPVRDSKGQLVHMPHLERMLLEAITAIRQVQFRRLPQERLHWNRVLLYVRPPLRLRRDEIEALSRRVGAQARGLGLEKVAIRALLPDADTGKLTDSVVSISSAPGQDVGVRFQKPSDEPMRPLDEYTQKVVRMRQRGLPYPYEVIRTLTPEEATTAGLPPGRFVEYDIDEDGRLRPVDRPYGKNKANIVVGVIRNMTAKYPEGMARVVLLGDPSKEMGSLAQPECERILAALDLASSMKVPLEWFSLSAGAKISMESGTENMDWIGRVLKRLVEFTQDGGEVNIVVIGINVGAQPYWNAEATMLMHTRGILVMTPDAAMVLTGKTALDYSGSVSAEDNIGIGGYEAIMGPNGQAQYWAPDIAAACQILLRYYDHTYLAPGQRFPRRAATADATTRDICLSPHAENDPEGFLLVGDIFSTNKNPARKKPFDIRRVMAAVADHDHQPLERWAGMRDAEITVTWDAHIGGYPVCLIGLESRQTPRVGVVPADGPEHWTSGTLFPMASKKMARSLNGASANRPVVILANLSGFDGSPESMRRRQLEFGAEIGRAVVNFKGPIIFCVISRYHGGAFVVFSRTLNDNMEVVALEGSFASVIGGAPAAAVVFAREVEGRSRKDSRVVALMKEADATSENDRPAIRARLAEQVKLVRSEKLGEVAEEFDRVHDVHRALRVGSLHRIIRASDLRPYLVDAIERGMAREMARLEAIILSGGTPGAPVV